jgi:hypothetical protein
MTIETEHPTFRGVVCLHCQGPIPVPTIVCNMQASAGEDTENPPKKSQVFNLRCPSCHKEKPYRTREIVEFEGTPEKVVLRELSAPVRWYPQDGLSRAAKA